MKSGNRAFIVATIDIVQYLERHELGAGLTRTMVGKCATAMDALVEISVQMATVQDSKEDVIHIVNMFRGSYAHKTALARQLLNTEDPWETF